MIQIRQLHKSYQTEALSLHVLKGLDLEIEAGEYVSIMGASGSGKSTLLNILGILDTYDEGEYYLNGTLIKGLSEKTAARYRNDYIGFVSVSKAHLVLVEVFSKRRHTFLPFIVSPRIPALFLAFRSCARSSMYLISSGVKSISVKKCLPLRFTAIVISPFFNKSYFNRHHNGFDIYFIRR